MFYNLNHNNDVDRYENQFSMLNLVVDDEQ